MSASLTDCRLSMAQRLEETASDYPDRVALQTVSRVGPGTALTFRALDRASNRVARALEKLGVGHDSAIVVCLPNGLDAVATTYGAWKLGALVLPLNPDMPQPERATVLRLLDRPIHATIVEGNHSGMGGRAVPAATLQRHEFSDEALDGVANRSPSAICSGGSTGTPKLFLHEWWESVDPTGPVVAMCREVYGGRSATTQLVNLPAFYEAGFEELHFGLFAQRTVVLAAHFAPRIVLDAIERYRVHYTSLTPTMLRLLLDDETIRDRDFSSLIRLSHSTGPCPATVKRAWIKLIGSRLRELYGATEDIGLTWIDGDEWLKHPGNVGRPKGCELEIRGHHGRPVGTGEVGEIFMRKIDGCPRATRRLDRPPPLHVLTCMRA